MTILNIKELSELLKIKKKNLYQWAELGQIPYVKLNGAFLMVPHYVFCLCWWDIPGIIKKVLHNKSTVPKIGSTEGVLGAVVA